MIPKTFLFVWKVFGRALGLVICLVLVFASYKANQPMSVQDAPEGMTYLEFMQDRIDAAKEISDCGESRCQKLFFTFNILIDVLNIFASENLKSL